MRIAQIAPVIRIGGIFHHFLVYKTLLPEVESVFVCLFDANDDDALLKLRPNVKNLRIPPKEHANLDLVQKTLRAALVEIAPDIVHSHHNFSDWYAIPVAHGLGIGAIRTVHGITQRDLREPLVVAPKKLNWSEEEIANQLALNHQVARTLTVSAHLRAKLISYGFSSDKVSVLRPEVSLDVMPSDSFNRSQSNDDAFCIAFPHRLEPIKNPGLMVQIIASLRDRGIRVRTYLPRAGTQLSEIESAMSWLVPVSDIWKQTPHADALLLTSFSEGLPVTALEAMARAIPVVAPRVGGIPEAVINGETGFLVEDEACDSYVDAFQALVRSPILCRRLGAAGRQRAVSAFGLDLHLQSLCRFYRSA